MNGRRSGPPRWGEPPKHLLEAGSLWIMIAVPSVWAAHFLLCYWIAAIWCAKLGGIAGSADAMRLVLGGLTLLALALIGILARHAVRRFDARLLHHEELTEDSEAERTRFLGNAALLLSALSAVAVIFTALPVLVFDRCF